MKKLERAEKDLWKVNEAEANDNKEFMERLSKWVIKYFGNVNVAQRLSIIKNSQMYDKI